MNSPRRSCIAPFKVAVIGIGRIVSSFTRVLDRFTLSADQGKVAGLSTMIIACVDQGPWLDSPMAPFHDQSVVFPGSAAPAHDFHVQQPKEAQRSRSPWRLLVSGSKLQRRIGSLPTC